jgi:hypothetical protein
MTLVSPATENEVSMELCVRQSSVARRKASARSLVAVVEVCSELRAVRPSVVARASHIESCSRASRIRKGSADRFSAESATSLLPWIVCSNVS